MAELSPLEKIKAMRQAKAHVLEPTAAEKEAELDRLFAKVNPMAEALQSAKIQPQPQKAIPQRGTEIYSVFGAGVILINGKEQMLPYLVTSPAELNRLRQEFSLNSPHSPLRTRELK